jgi:hypothetical protein
MSILLFVASLALTIGGLVHLMRTDDENVRLFSKFVWSLIVVFVPIIGPVAWFGFGRRWTASEARSEWRRRAQAGRPIPPPRGIETTPEEDAAAIEAEIRFHEQQAEIRRLEAKLEQKRSGGTEPPIPGQPSGKT